MGTRVDDVGRTAQRPSRRAGPQCHRADRNADRAHPARRRDAGADGAARSIPAPSSHLERPRGAGAQPAGLGRVRTSRVGAVPARQGQPQLLDDGSRSDDRARRRGRARERARALEQSVVYYGDTTQVYFDNWKRLAAKSTASALTYLSAVVTDERSVVAYNTAAAPGATTFAANAPRPNLPLVAIYPKDTTIESDDPIIALDAPWASPPARRAWGSSRSSCSSPRRRRRSRPRASAPPGARRTPRCWTRATASTPTHTARRSRRRRRSRSNRR